MEKTLILHFGICINLHVERAYAMQYQLFIKFNVRDRTVLLKSIMCMTS
jgi:hypothetical protein